MNFSCLKAHDCSIRGVATDALNLITITCAENGEVKFWPFKEKKILHSCVENHKHVLKLEESIDKIILHRERLNVLKIFFSKFLKLLLIFSLINKVEC